MKVAHMTAAPMSYIGNARLMLVTALGFMAALFGGQASAFVAPAAGDFGYDIYDIVINKMLNGPIGWVGAAVLLVFGVAQIMKQWLVTVVCVLGATIIIKISTILTSLGATIPLH